MKQEVSEIKESLIAGIIKFQEERGGAGQEVEVLGELGLLTETNIQAPLIG